MEYDYKKYLELAKNLISEFKSNLPERVDPASLSMKSKLPFKAISLREVLFYRITELGEVAIELFERKKVVSAFIMTRSVMETAGMLCLLCKKIEKVVDDRNVGGIDDFLMKALFGAKDGKGPTEALNILTAINHTNNKVDNFRDVYDSLSEFAHPNWSGVSGAYSKIDKENIWVDLGAEVKEIPLCIGLSPLVGTLEFFTVVYNNMADYLPNFVEICDEDIERKQTQQ